MKSHTDACVSVSCVLQDKLRLLAVYTLATKASSADLTELQDVLREAYANTPTPCPPNWPSRESNDETQA